MEDFDFESDFEVADEDEAYSLNSEGARDVSGWVHAAWQSGHFDWDLLCGDASDEAVAERWRLAHWLNEMRMLDEPFAEVERDEYWDDETGALIMLAHFFISVRNKAEALGMRPTDHIEITLMEAAA